MNRITGAHKAHCCVIHGCKYGDKDCPVVNRKTEQDYCCENCDGSMRLSDLQHMRYAKFSIGDKVYHKKYGFGVILGNYHLRTDGNYYWHIKYDTGSYGYNTEKKLKEIF